MGEILVHDDDRYKLRLFDDRLGHYYNVYVTGEDLTVVLPLTRQEAKAVERERTDVIKVQEVRRAEEKRKRAERAAKERERKAALRRAGGKVTSSSGRSSRSRTQSKKGAQAIAESLDTLDVRLFSLAERLHTSFKKNETQMEKLRAAYASAAAKLLRSDLVEASANLQEIQEKLEYRQSRADSLRRSANRPRAKAKEVDEEVQDFLRGLRRVERSLGEVEESLDSAAQRLVALPTGPSADELEEEESVVVARSARRTTEDDRDDSDRSEPRASRKSDRVVWTAASDRVETSSLAPRAARVSAPTETPTASAARAKKVTPRRVEESDADPVEEVASTEASSGPSAVLIVSWGIIAVLAALLVVTLRGRRTGGAALQ